MSLSSRRAETSQKAEGDPAGRISPPVLLESHMHTPLCGHARGEIGEYVRSAIDQNLAGVIVTCHNPMPEGYGSYMRMQPSDFARYLNAVESARAVWAGRGEVRLGIEADYVPGYETFLAQQLGSAPFDFVLGSVHPQVPEYQEKYYDGRAWPFAKLYFEHLAEAAETGLFDALAHPDMVKFLLGPRWEIQRAMDDILPALDRIAATGVAMEFNTSGWARTFREASPGQEMLQAMAYRAIPVTLGGDAHAPHRVGERFRRALRCMYAVGYTHVSLFNQRQRYEVTLEQAYDTLAPRRTAAA